MSIAAIVKKNMNRTQRFVQFSESYIKRNNPVLAVYQTFVKYLKNLLTANKKMKIAKYRVNHLKYRLYQMEQLIDTGNPYNKSNGKSINILR